MSDNKIGRRFFSIKSYPETHALLEKLSKKYSVTMSLFLDFALKYIAEANINPMLDTSFNKEKRLMAVQGKLEQTHETTIKRIKLLEEDYLQPIMARMQELFIILSNKDYAHLLERAERKGVIDKIVQKEIASEKGEKNRITEETQKIHELNTERNTLKDCLAMVAKQIHKERLAGGKKRYILNISEAQLLEIQSLAAS